MREFEFSQKEVEDKVKTREREIEKLGKTKSIIKVIYLCFLGASIIITTGSFIVAIISENQEYKKMLSLLYMVALILYVIISFLVDILKEHCERNIKKKKKFLKSLIIHEIINDTLLTTKDLVKPNSDMEKQITYHLLKTLDFTKDEKGNIEVDISFTNGYEFHSCTEKIEDWLTKDIKEAITDFSVSDIRIKESDGKLKISFIISNNKFEEVDKMIVKTNEEDLCNYLELKELDFKELEQL